MRTVGLNRLMGTMGVLLPLYGENTRNKNIAEEIKSLDKAMFYRYTGNPDSLNTIKLINENAEAIMNGPTLANIPVLVISSDNGDEWKNVQLQLVSWSENSEQVTIKDSEHYIYWSNLDRVVEEIEAFLKK